MNMKRLILAAAAVLVLAMAAPASAGVRWHTTAIPSETVAVVDLGRRLMTVITEAGAGVQCSAQGQLVDTNGNGLVDSLRGRAACKEQFRTLALRIYDVQVQSDFADTWAPVVTTTTDAASPDYAISYTPSSRFCPPPDNFNLTYRVVQRFGVRSLDGSLATFTLTSYQFAARAVDAALNDVC